MGNYGTIYTLPFQSRKGVDYAIEIQKENYTGRFIELKGSGETPFTVEIDDEDFLYNPTRFSSATIRVVGDDYLQSLYSTGYQQYRVDLKRNNKVEWTGFISPELYSQDYTSTVFDLEIQCISAMSTLEFVNYEKKDSEKMIFVSIWELLTKCIEKSRGSYSSVYIPHVYAKDATDYNNNVNVIQGMTISEQNFFDEDDKAMTLKEVIEEICKFLNWTCVDWKGDLYFVDVDHKGEYYKYNSSLSSYTIVDFETLNVQNVGFAGSEHYLDILGGYNKASIRTSNYPVENLLPKEEFENNKVLNDFVSRKDKKRCRRLYLQPKSWNMYGDNFNGGAEMRYCNYNIVNEKPDISDYSYTDVIEARCHTLDEDVEIIGLNMYDKIMSFKGASSIYQSGAFCLSGSFKTIGKFDHMVPWNNSRGTWMKIAAFQLRIRDEYYGSKNGLPPFEWSADSNKYVHIPSSSGNNDFQLDYVSIRNDKTLNMPYKNVSGFIIPIEQILYGDLEFSLYAAHMPKYADLVDGFLLKDFEFKYVKEDTAEKTNGNSDRYYENVVNESYINELDEIEFKISSYNDDGACYSKVMLYDEYLTDNLYSSIEGKHIRPEEQLIRRIINQYSTAKIRLTQVLKHDNSIMPTTFLTDKFMSGKQFIVTGGIIDFATDSFTCKMIEK